MEIMKLRPKAVEFCNKRISGTQFTMDDVEFMHEYLSVYSGKKLKMANVLESVQNSGMLLGNHINNFINHLMITLEINTVSKNDEIVKFF